MVARVVMGAAAALFFGEAVLGAIAADIREAAFALCSLVSELVAVCPFQLFISG